MGIRCGGKGAEGAFAWVVMIGRLVVVGRGGGVCVLAMLLCLT